MSCSKSLLGLGARLRPSTSRVWQPVLALLLVLAYSRANLKEQTAPLPLPFTDAASKTAAPFTKGEQLHLDITQDGSSKAQP
mmetsp:Transcript_33371/g.65750  ORF Transcript_33371/g.65750 Transcript_33371/m.65750 type:complete len:82 (+) Transcript_33371:1534-1779(+)